VNYLTVYPEEAWGWAEIHIPQERGTNRKKLRQNPKGGPTRPLLPCPQERCDDPGIAATVEHGHDQEWFFVGGVRNQKIPHELKTKRPGSQIRADVAHLGEWDEGANRFLDLAKGAVGSTWTIGSDIFPNLG
jgi:hypothetical protein